MTYSIVARDQGTGQIGVAAQSYYFALGAVLPWARAGVGAVATQARIDPGYGPRGLGLLAAGVQPIEVLNRLRIEDDKREERQVGIVDASGAVASFTGSQCIPEVSHASGNGYSAQANLMARGGVCRAMAEAYESAMGPLAERLMAALLAAQAAGGDARGQLSAAILIVDGTRRDQPWDGVVVDARVDHHPDPLGELGRLLRVAQSQEQDTIAGDKLLSGDPAGALVAIDTGLRLVPGDPELLANRACALIGLGRIDEAKAIVGQIVAAQPGWAKTLRALEQRKLLPFIDDTILASLLE
jgi:uncharacterized Ntn-hydrolase superfamily protein